MTEEDAWQEVRECAIASQTSPEIIIIHAKAEGLGPQSIIDRYYRAWEIRDDFPHLQSFPFGYFAATPPGFVDVRMLYQNEEPIWWVDILRTPYRINDVETFTDQRLDGAVAYLREHARELFQAARSAQLEDSDRHHIGSWVQATPLWKHLTAEAERRQDAGGRSPIVAMRQSTGG